MGNAQDQCRSRSAADKCKKKDKMYTGKSFNRTPYIDKYPHVCKKKKGGKKKK